jgi:hypothetical protein
MFQWTTSTQEPAQSAIGLLFSIFGLSFSDSLIIQVGFVMRPSERPFEVTLFSMTEPGRQRTTVSVPDQLSATHSLSDTPGYHPSLSDKTLSLIRADCFLTHS